MDTIYQEIGVPRKQIRETQRSDRFIVITNRSWIKCLIQQKQIAKFPCHPGFDEWPTKNDDLGNDWCLTYFVVYKKYSHKVIPLPSCRRDTNDLDSLLNFSQLLQHISMSNHRNLWKSSYQKYTGQRSKVLTKELINKNERNTVTLVPYDSVLLEAITRTYGCDVIHMKLDKMKSMSVDGEKKRCTESQTNRYEMHINLYPIASIIETTTHYVVVHDNFIENSLYDCITYSPAVLDRSYSKPLFMIYQLLQLMKSLHDRGLLLGNIGLDDIFLTDNLWLQVMPRLNLNILQSIEENESACNAAETFATTGNQRPVKLSTNDYLSYSLKDYCEMWCNGQISNFDYLTILNNLSGRHIDNPQFHHIMPWVTDFVSRNGMNWRDLTKSKYRLNKGDVQLDLTFVPSSDTTNMKPHHVSDVLSEITYYVYMARRTPKSILCKHVRPNWVPAEYPASISRLYDWTPDECIPEFFTDPLVFKSIHEDLPDLEVPTWSTCPEDFVTRHREALESQYVSERLHYWIDLNFGYKLAGNAAIKAKNVYLSMVDGHQTLCQHGIVQLFTHPHPPKQYQTPWTSKTPPRIYTQSERRRLTRSTEDLSQKNLLNIRPERVTLRSNSKNRTHSPNIPEEMIGSIERSPSMHLNALKSFNQIILPKEFNPVEALNAVENMEIFLSTTFYNNVACEQSPHSAIDYKPSTKTIQNHEEGVNAFTNKIFTDRFEEALMKDTKRLHNLNHKNLYIQNSTRNFKQIVSEHRYRELQVIACIVVEIFLAKKLRPMGSGTAQTFDQRVAACKNVLKRDFEMLPKCVRYPVELLFSIGDDLLSTPVTEIGLPKPSASQLLQPFLSNFLFPFPTGYLQVYALLKSLTQYSQVDRLLDIYTYYECDGNNCKKYESLDLARAAVKRKIAECKVMACALQADGLFLPHGYEQFNLVDLILPHIVDLLIDEETSILTAWNVFDNIAIALGPKATQKHLLEPILKLYEAESLDRIMLMTSATDATIKNAISSSKSEKTIKLYHHIFLLRLIVRFGLNCFLNNFIPPLIEAIGGYKEPLISSSLHFHGVNERKCSINRSKSHKNLKMCNEETDDERKRSENDGMFAFESENEESGKSNIQNNSNESVENDTDSINRIIDQLDMSISGGASALDLRLNHSTAVEMTEETSPTFRLSLDKITDDMQSATFKEKSSGPTSPTIPIPPSSTVKRNQFNTIDCEVGSKQSNDEDYMESIMNSNPQENRSENNTSTSSKSTPLKRQPSTQDEYRISDMSAESVIWLSHRLGPVLTARYITRNLLKMLTLCYVGQENLLPDLTTNEFNSTEDNINLLHFTIADSRIVGDSNSSKVLECLKSITTIFGDQFILLQYFPHVVELIILCKKRITANLEGGLISSLQLLKYLVPCLSDSIIMEQLHDTILKNIIHPIIRLIASTGCLMPNGFLARSVLARKLLDIIYVVAVRIGPEMTKEHLCIPALQRFFLIFDKAYGITDNFTNDTLHEDSRNAENSASSDDSNFIEIRRDGLLKEWSVKGTQITPSKNKGDAHMDSLTPPKIISEITGDGVAISLRENALDEIRDVFTPQLAHIAYVPFLKYLGDHIMRQFVKNLMLILNLCHEYEQPNYNIESKNNRKHDISSGKLVAGNDEIDAAIDGIYSNSFGTAVIGNRIEVSKDLEKNEIGPMELLDLVAHKYERINTTRHLRGNWLAYWEHEIGRPEKSNHFNFKQIKLQTFAGHASSVRSLLCLDNENSFISASKDKTVKLWSLRSEGDGTKISACQFTYSNHRKSVHSLAFLDSLRLAVSCDSGVHIWDPFVGGDIGQLESHKLAPVSIVRTYPAPSALILAGTAESTVKIIDARTFSYVNEWKLTPNTNGSVRCLAVAPSGNWIAVGLSSGQMILCDGRTGLIRSSWKATDGELLQLIAVNEDQVISSSLDHSICVWRTSDGALMHYMKNPNEPSHCLASNQNELLFGTPANRIGVYSSISSDATYSITKLRSETFKGVLTSFSLLPLNRMLLVGGDSGNISLLC